MGTEKAVVTGASTGVTVAVVAWSRQAHRHQSERQQMSGTAKCEDSQMHTAYEEIAVHIGIAYEVFCLCRLRAEPLPTTSWGAVKHQLLDCLGQCKRS